MGIFALSLSFCATKAQVTICPEVGFTAAGLYTDDEDIYAGFNFHVSATAHLHINDILAVRPSVLFKSGQHKKG